MGEAKNNPNAKAKAEGKASGFRREITDIAVITKLAAIGLEGLKLIPEADWDNVADREVMEGLLKLGPSVIAKFEDTGKYLFERAQKNDNPN